MRVCPSQLILLLQAGETIAVARPGGDGGSRRPLVSRFYRNDVPHPLRDRGSGGSQAAKQINRETRLAGNRGGKGMGRSLTVTRSLERTHWRKEQVPSRMRPATQKRFRNSLSHLCTKR